MIKSSTKCSIQDYNMNVYYKVSGFIILITILIYVLNYYYNHILVIREKMLSGRY